jgi:hypothetical protein
MVAANLLNFGFNLRPGGHVEIDRNGSSSSVQSDKNDSEQWDIADRVRTVTMKISGSIWVVAIVTVNENESSSYVFRMTLNQSDS